MRIAALLLRSMAFLVLFSQLDAGIIVDVFPHRPEQCFLKLFHNPNFGGHFEVIRVNNTEWTTLKRAQLGVMSLEVMGPCEWEISSGFRRSAYPRNEKQQKFWERRGYVVKINGARRYHTYSQFGLRGSRLRAVRMKTSENNTTTAITALGKLVGVGQATASRLLVVQYPSLQTTTYATLICFLAMGHIMFRCVVAVLIQHLATCIFTCGSGCICCACFCFQCWMRKAWFPITGLVSLVSACLIFCVKATVIKPSRNLTNYGQEHWPQT